MYKLFNRIAAETSRAPPQLPPPPAPVRAAEPEVVREVEEQILLPCPICFRTFKVESLDRHKNVCQKVGTKKRKVFDSAKQRLEDLPDVPKVSPLSPQQKVPSSPLVRKSLDQPTFNKVPTWKEKHLSLIRTVREARGVENNRCPCCERNFNDKAFDRHVEWCREQQSRIPKSPTNTEAKERWEARTKYRAPLLRRSIRSKYSPTRSVFSSSGSPAASVDRLTVPDCAQSLSGSRASLDSRASSTYSYQPSSTFSRSSNYSNYNNNNNRNNNLYNSSTLGRVGGSAFLRQANERRSLRVAPPSPPPIRRVAEPPPVAVTLTPINNNRTSALRASLRMKNPFTSSSSSSSNSYQSNPVKPAFTRQPTTLVPPSPTTPAKPSFKFNSNSIIGSSQNNNTTNSNNLSSSSSSNNKRPTVLQLFTSAFSRPSPVAATKNRGNNTTTLSAGHLGGHGRRSEPEGVESKLMTGSCYNYSAPPSKMKASRSTPNLGKRLVIGTSLLPNKVRPLTYTGKKSRFGSDHYDPYLSAERQMAELFDDRPKETSPPPPPVNARVTSSSQPAATAAAAEESASMEQLEKDLKSILSEISQLGQTSTKERETTGSSWQSSKTPATSPSIRLTPAKVANSSSTPTTPITPEQEESRPIPKFCHSCGASYPDRHTVVKFCCQCGARRLYV